MTVVPLTRLGIPRTGVTRTGDTADGCRVVSARARYAHRPLSFLEFALLVSVVGVAAAVGIPQYLQIRRETNDDAAKSRLSSAARVLEARHSSAGTFAGAVLPSGVRLHMTAGSYCIDTSEGGSVWHAARHAKPVSGSC